MPCRKDSGITPAISGYTENRKAMTSTTGPAARRRVSSIRAQDRKSTRLNSSHGYISYAVFCLKKKKAHSRPQPDANATDPGLVHRRNVVPIPVPHDIAEACGADTLSPKHIRSHHLSG